MVCSARVKCPLNVHALHACLPYAHWISFYYISHYQYLLLAPNLSQNILNSELVSTEVWLSHTVPATCQLSSLVLVAWLALVFLAGVSVLSSKGCALQAPLLMVGCNIEGSVIARQLSCWRSSSKLSLMVWVMRLFLECHESSSWEQ